MVNVAKYPICPTCKVPFVLRLSFALVDGRKWVEQFLWQRDCKHKFYPKVRMRIL